ncbi:hypothetical protein B0H14DRAFT_2346661 [Mycena olivaceomarginata]|nr:hypothetical protein B0H14DRAFT_2346661 [Mycena olivaceomarginata]
MASGVQPQDSLANFQYYGRAELPPEVLTALEKATPFDLLLTAHSRSTRITYLFCDKDGSKHDDAARLTSQGYSKGNVAIFAQDVATLRKVLPPPRAEIHEAMCALFVGPTTVPTKENIEALRPVLVSKNRVQTILDFLLSRNAYYVSAGVQFSQTNLDGLYREPVEEGVLDAVELCCLPDSTLDAKAYADRGDTEDGEGLTRRTTGGETVMEAVGYVVGEKTPRDLRNMKASAVAWCLDKNNYLRVQSGSRFLSDRDPGFLTYNFPHLDPWGIGGFNEPSRTAKQHISFERQVSNLLMQSDGTFQKDPNFAYVCWNIIQKTEVNRQISFRTPARQQAGIVADIQEMAPVITELIRKWEFNPTAKPSNKNEKKAMRTLSKLKVLARDLKGSSGYKQCRRNEIRGLIKKFSTPALFLTLNPADIADPLLGAIAGVVPDEWKELEQFPEA